MWGTGIATSIGLGASALWMFYLGAYLSSIGNFSSGTTNLLLSVTNGVGHWFSDVTGVVILAVLVLGGSVNLYAGVNTGLGIEASFRPGEATPRNSRKARIAALVPITAICLWASFLYAGNFYVDFNDALAVLLILLVPWSAINLTDFYYIRRGHYRLEDMFNRRGPYGLIGWSGMIAFVASFVIELPFANLGFWDGPLSKRWFDGGDFSWVVGLIVGAVVYAGLAWKIRVSVSDTDRLRHAQVHVTDSPSTLEMVPEAELYGSE
jgi:NCS1 family nucleobase:cation symporter-1